MVFAYYRNLNKRQKSIYRQSDARVYIALQNIALHRSMVPFIQQALINGQARSLEQYCLQLVQGLCDDLKLDPVRVKVGSQRPHNEYEELQGYYEAEDGKTAEITVWMRTAKRRQIVAFATFMRTLLHEFCHHVDFCLYGWEESFHTDGFYKRESSLYKQLVS